MVVAEIIMGIIIGQSILNLVHKDSMLNILSTLGFIFLMFLSGLEIDFSTFKKIREIDKVRTNMKKMYQAILI